MKENAASCGTANALARDDRPDERPALVRACFEGWANDEMSALALLEQGKVNFVPLPSR